MTATKTAQVKATFERWLEDQMVATSMDHDKLAKAIGVSSKQLTWRITNPAYFSAEEFMRLANVFNKHWFNDIICAFPEKLKPVLASISMDQAFAAAHQNGEQWRLVTHAA